MSNCKYYKQKKQVSYDSGQTWSDVSPVEYQVGDLYQIDSPDCSEIGIIRWVLVPGDYLCDGKDKYQKEIEQYTIDGVVWRNMYPTTYRKGTLIESNSSLCNYKWEGHYTPNSTDSKCPKGYRWVEGVGCVYVDPIKIVLCSTSSSTTLASSETSYSPYALLYGFIGDCCSEIGNNAFLNKSTLSSVSISNTVTTIGNGAFYGCSGLTSIDLPSGLTSIGSSAFRYCVSLTSIDIPSGVTSINDYVFSSCYSLSYIDIPNSITSIGSGAYSNCTSLTEVTIPSSVTSIGSGAFSGCSNIISIMVEATTPPTLNNSNAFSGTNNCTIYVPCESVLLYREATNWSDIASRIQGIPPCVIPHKFDATYTSGRTYIVECSMSSTTLTIGEAQQSSGYLVRDMLSAAIGNCVTTIGQQAFNECYNLSSITISDSVEIIEQQAFSGCSSLVNVEIPSGVTIISGSVFSNCYRLSSITIPDSVTSIGYGVFNGCTGLTSCTLGSGITSISNSLFYNCQYLTSVNIPSGVTSIEWDAFSNCYRLSSIIIPDSVTSIEMNAFYNCTGLTSVTIGSGVTSIGYEAFRACISLTSVTINATTPPTLYGSVFYLTNENLVIYVPSASVNAYKAASGWSDYSSRIQAIP